MYLMFGNYCFEEEKVGFILYGLEGRFLLKSRLCKEVVWLIARENILKLFRNGLGGCMEG